MISSGRGPTNIPMTGGSATGDLSKVWDAAASGDTVAAQRLIALGREHPGLGRVLDQMSGRSGPPRDVQTGRFLPRNIAPPTQGGITITQVQTFYRDMHQMAVDIHRVTSASRVGQQYGPFAPGGPFGPYRPAQQYGPYPPSGQYGPYHPMGGPTVPPSGPPPTPFGPWGPRGGGPLPPPPRPPRGGGGGGGGGGGWFGGGGGGAGGGALAGVMRGHGILRGVLLGEIASELGGSIVKDFANPSRLAREMYEALEEGTGGYTNIAKSYYSAGTAGRFSGAALTRHLLPMHKNEGDINPPDWMIKYGITNEEIIRNQAQFGIAPQSVDDYIDIAQRLAINTRKPGFAGLNPAQPIGMARQAAALGMETTTGAVDGYLRKLEESGARWTLEGVDRARVFQNMQQSLETISKTGATGIAGESVRGLFDKLVASGLPGARTGDLPANMIAGATGFNNALGSDPFKSGLVGLALQKHGGWNAESVKKLLGPEVMKSIGGEGSEQFQQITRALTGGDWPGAAALIGNALNNDPTRINQVLTPLLRGMGIPEASTAKIISNLTGQPISVGMGLTGTGPGAGGGNMPWESASKLIQQFESSGGKNIKNPTSTASGPWQMLDDTWKETASGLGIDVNQYPTAMSAPIEIQERVAHALYSKRGFQPWTVGNPRLAQHLATISGASPSGVSTSLNAAMQFAVSKLPPGYTAKMTSGLRPGDSGQHGRGKAEDWQIFDANGNPISNRGQDTSGLYRRMAVAANVYALSHGGKPIVWGGHFGTEKGGSGEDDIMHFDEGDIRGLRGDNMSEVNEARKLIASGAVGITNAPTDPNDITPRTEIGEGGVQIPPGAGIAPRREAAGASEGARNLELFGDAVPKLVKGFNDVDGALKKFEGALGGAISKLYQLGGGSTPPPTTQ